MSFSNNYQDQRHRVITSHTPLTETRASTRYFSVSFFNFEKFNNDVVVALMTSLPYFTSSRLTLSHGIIILFTMKRSTINTLISEAVSFFDSLHFKLPPWAFWRPLDWRNMGHTEIVQNQLGWDLTDYGAGHFEKKGLILFTIRNGNLTTQNSKQYAEKIMIVREEQVCPMHFHWSKTEDIINRGGGNLLIELYNSTPDESFSDQPLTVMIDGIPRVVNPGGIVVLRPGESIFLQQGVYHRFYGEKGKGQVLVGEVSSVNDDNSDNRFYTPQARFPKIDEDVEPLHLLCTDYPKYI